MNLPVYHRIWHNLGTIEVFPSESWVADLAMRVRHIARNYDTDDLVLLNAAAILDRVASEPKALAILFPTVKDGNAKTRSPREPNAIWVAADLLATWERLVAEGKKSKAARSEAFEQVATAWKKSPATLERYLTKHRHGARNLIAARIGRADRPADAPPDAIPCVGMLKADGTRWERKELLLALSRDLRAVKKNRLAVKSAKSRR